MAEFTGERVVPEKVDVDLWNEHRARYLFAARLGRQKRVLDVGCGTGYGTAELAAAASYAVGLDRSADAIAYGAGRYSLSNLRFLVASAEDLPVRDSSIDLVVSFELIEHLTDWKRLLEEARRVLAPKGQFIVSTPNKVFYSESRQQSGPNPYHVHEFEFHEFREALAEYFPYVLFFLQNHSAGVVFHPIDGDSMAEVRLDAKPVSPEDANFFVAVCALAPQAGAPAFVHIPTAANVLRERSEHIQLLAGELETKDHWLEQSRREHEQLLERHRALELELEERNRWAEQLNEELEHARGNIERLETELAERAISYESKIATLEQEKDTQSRWALETSRELTQCVEMLHATEKTVEERTIWAKSLDRQVEHLEAMLGAVEGSRWFRLGRAFNLGPELRQK